MRIATLLCVLALFVVGACKKESQQKFAIDSQLSIRVLNGHVAFTTTADYDRYLELTDEDKQQVVSSLHADVSFKPFSKNSSSLTGGNFLPIGNCAVPDDVVEDNPVLFDVMDKNGVVQIGTDLWRLDYCNNNVYLISVADALDPLNYNDFLIGNFANPVVGVFPTSVDALDAVAAGIRTMPDSLYISGNGLDDIFAFASVFGTWAHENKYFNDVYVAESTITGWNGGINDNTRMNGKISYDKFAIYFHFYGKEKYQRNAITGLWQTAKIDDPSHSSTQWKVDYNYTYLRKGSGQTLQSASGQLLPGNNVKGAENKTDKTFYDGRRGLKKDYGHAQWNVTNNLTNKVKVYRNKGIGEQYIFTNANNRAQAMPNYDLGSPNTTRYFISF
jgi:hypothetical protein